MRMNVAIITGGAKGIGLACVRRFVEDGFHVVLADIDGEAGKKAVGEFRERVRFVQCDVAERLDLRNLLTATLNAFGRVDVLINNAGIARRAAAVDLGLEDFDDVLAVNVRAPFVLSQMVARQMQAQIEAEAASVSDETRDYAIINMSSINAVMAIPNNLAYSVSKGALNQLTTALAIELAPLGVRVNAIGPGSVGTDLLQAVIAKDKVMRGKLLARTPLGRIADTSEIAAVAAFLASPDARYVTGQCLYVDGGRLALNTWME